MNACFGLTFVPVPWKKNRRGKMRQPRASLRLAQQEK
jgi:hypothetical protein